MLHVHVARGENKYYRQTAENTFTKSIRNVLVMVKDIEIPHPSIQSSYAPAVLWKISKHVT